MNASLPSLEAIDAAVHAELAPLAVDIDVDGAYPEAFLRHLGALGGYGASLVADEHHPLDLRHVLTVAAHVGAVSGAAAFAVWCQFTCAWYLRHATVPATRARYLDAVVRGELLAGTGMSNTMKHLAGIEKIRLSARREGDGYVLNGVLPWVSNLAAHHLVIVAAAVDTGGYAMFAVETGTPGYANHPCPEFSGMEGSRTLSLRFKQVRVAADQVLAHPEQFDAFIARIKPGFLLGQVGMGLGVVDACIKVLHEHGGGQNDVNAYLDVQEDDLQAARDVLVAETALLAAQAQVGKAALLPVLRLRAEASELALRAGNAAVLHAGARGYIRRHAAQRLLREAVFVAIVTPALKHLRKEIHDLEQAASRAEAA